MPDDLENHELTEDQREGLSALRDSPLPPQALEARVVSALRNERLLVSPARWVKPLKLATAGILLFALGWMSARWRSAAPRELGQPRFVLFLEKGEEAPIMGSEQENIRASEYARWARQLSASGHPASGERLAHAGAELQTISGAETSWTDRVNSVQGYFIVSAKDLPEAIELARTCPHLKYGGTIEVRPIDTPR